MPYDQKLANRVRAVFQSDSNYTEQEMFGCPCFMIGSNIAVAVSCNGLMVRPGPINFPSAITLPHARLMDFTGSPTKGFVYVDSEGLITDTALTVWVERGAAYARSLPAK